MAGTINHLSAKQEQLLSDWPELWRGFAFSCDRFDRRRAMRAAELAYVAAGFKPPEASLVVDSPFSGAIMSTLLMRLSGDLNAHGRDEVQPRLSELPERAAAYIDLQIGEPLREEIAHRTWSEVDTPQLDQVIQMVAEQVLDAVWSDIFDVCLNRMWRSMERQLWPDVRSPFPPQDRDRLHDEVGRAIHRPRSSQMRGCHDARTLAYYAYVGEVLRLECAWLTKGLVQLAKCCGWWTAYHGTAMFQHRPSQLHFNTNGQLHCDGGPAILYRDGFAVWALNGVRVPKWLAETRDTELDPHRLTRIKNAEIRREFVRKVGIDRICYSLKTKTIDRQGTYVLLVLQLGDRRRRPYLKMLNPSIGTWHVEGVHPSCKTVTQALAWRDDEQRYVKPDVLT